MILLRKIISSHLMRSGQWSPSLTMMVWITVKINHLLLLLQGQHNYHSWHRKNNISNRGSQKCVLLGTLLASEWKSLSYLLFCKYKCPFGTLPFCSVWMRKLSDLEKPWGNMRGRSPGILEPSWGSRFKKKKKKKKPETCLHETGKDNLYKV